MLAVACTGAGKTAVPEAASVAVVAGAPREVDLLLVVDSTDSMAALRSDLAASLPGLFDALATGDVDGDGIADFSPPQTIHAGVITMWDGFHETLPPSLCADPVYGDRGRLQTAGAPSQAGCDATYPPFQTITAGSGVEAAASGLACVVEGLSGGCSIRQPIFSILQALSSGSPYGELGFPIAGQADGANAGFLGNSSVLAVLTVSNEDDCSSLDPTIYLPSADYPEPFGPLRCERERHHTGIDLSTTAEQLGDLRPGHPERVLFMPIGGIPSDLAPDHAVAQFDLLPVDQDPRMMPMPNHGDLASVLPVCTSDSFGAISPTPGLVEVQTDQDNRVGYAGSLCNPDLGKTLSTAMAVVGKALAASCLPSDLPDDIHGTCQLVEGVVPHTIDDHPRCGDLPGRDPTPLRTGPGGLIECVIRPDRWHVDTSGFTRQLCAARPPARRIALDGIEAPRSGAYLRLWCNLPCTSDADCAAHPSFGALTICEPTTHTCRVGCVHQADCAGLDDDTCQKPAGAASFDVGVCVHGG